MVSTPVLTPFPLSRPGVSTRSTTHSLTVRLSLCSVWLADTCRIKGQWVVVFFWSRERHRQTDRCLTVHKSRSSRRIRCLSCGRRDKGSGGSSSPEWSNQDSKTEEGSREREYHPVSDQIHYHYLLLLNEGEGGVHGGDPPPPLRCSMNV